MARRRRAPAGGGALPAPPAPPPRTCDRAEPSYKREVPADDWQGDVLHQARQLQRACRAGLVAARESGRAVSYAAGTLGGLALSSRMQPALPPAPLLAPARRCTRMPVPTGSPLWLPLKCCAQSRKHNGPTCGHDEQARYAGGRRQRRQHSGQRVGGAQPCLPALAHHGGRDGCTGRGVACSRLRCRAVCARARLACRAGPAGWPASQPGRRQQERAGCGPALVPINQLVVTS